MTATAILLLITAACMHAGWNFVSKRRHPTAGFFLAANAAGAAFLAPLAIIYAPLLTAFPWQTWCLLAASGLFLAVYFSGLAGAYTHGQMSIAYPLARSTPVILVMIVTFIVGRADQVTLQCVIGIVLVVAGCLLLPMRKFGDFRLRNYLNLSCMLALLAAVGTAGYTLTDDEALRRLRGTPAGGDALVAGPAVYLFFEAVATALFLGLSVLARPAARRDLAVVLRTEKRSAGVTGAAIFTTYGLVLISMAFVRNVSYVAAFRQLSIPIGAILGIALLKEPRPAPKLAGVAAIFIGLALVGTG